MRLRIFLATQPELLQTFKSGLCTETFLLEILLKYVFGIFLGVLTVFFYINWFTGIFKDLCELFWAITLMELKDSVTHFSMELDFSLYFLINPPGNFSMNSSSGRFRKQSTNYSWIFDSDCFQNLCRGSSQISWWISPRIFP